MRADRRDVYSGGNVKLARMAIVNLYGDEWDVDRDRAGWRWRRLHVGGRLGAELIGAGLYELEPGQKTFPYHYHHALEEMAIVVRGEPTLRTPEGERRLVPGDCVTFKRGPEGAHAFRNDTDEPARLLMLSSQADVEITVYPDSEKIGAMAGDLRLIVPKDAGIDYFQGED